MDRKKYIPKKWLSSLLSLVVAIVMLCVSIVAFSSMNQTTAWFAMNNEVNSNGISVIVNDPQKIRVTLSSYAVSSIENGIYTLSEDQLFTLPTTDKQNILYSDYKKALAVIIEISSKEDRTVAVNLTTPNSDFTTFDYNSSPNVISNCMQITYGTLGTSSDGKKTVTLAGAAQSFVSVTGDTISNQKAESLNLLPSPQEPIFIEGGAAQPIKLCYIIEYNEDYIDYIFEHVTTALSMRFDHDIYFNISSVDSN